MRGWVGSQNPKKVSNLWNKCRKVCLVIISLTITTTFLSGEKCICSQGAEGKCPESSSQPLQWRGGIRQVHACGRCARTDVVQKRRVWQSISDKWHRAGTSDRRRLPQGKWYLVTPKWQVGFVRQADGSAVAFPTVSYIRKCAYLMLPVIYLL